MPIRECEQGVVQRDRVHHSCCDEVKTLESQVTDLKAKFFEVVGVMQGSGMDKEVFDKVYKIATGVIENRAAEPSQKCPACLCLHDWDSAKSHTEHPDGPVACTRCGVEGA